MPGSLHTDARPGTRADDEVESMSNEALSVREVWSILWNRRWLVVAVAIGGLTTGILAGVLITPQYRVKAVLVPAESGSEGLFSSLMGSFGGLSSMMGMSGMMQDYTTEALALFESRRFVQQFIEDENLMPKLFPRDWDPEAKAWRDAPEDAPTLWKSYFKFSDRFRAFKDRKTGLVTVEMDWPDRLEAARLVNTIIDRVNQDMRGRAMSESTLTIDYLQKEVDAARSIELQKTIYGLIENQIKIKAVASARQQFAFKVLDPALAPDADDMIKPKPVLYAVGGTILGGMLGVLAALVFNTGSPASSRAESGQRRNKQVASGA